VALRREVLPEVIDRRSCRSRGAAAQGVNAQSRPGRWTPAIVFGAWALVMGLWAVANPLMTGPDEPQHIINAVAVAHGQVGRATVGSPIGRRFLVDVPDYVVQERRNACTAFHPNITAACQRPRPARAGMSAALTQFNNYPALYYAVVGSATYATSGLPAFVAMRVLSVLLCAAMLTAATSFLLWSRWRRRVLLGLAAGITPMTLFLTGVVNDSGFEITAGVAAYAGAIHLCTVTRPTRRARVLFAVVCLCFANARAPDVVFLPAIVVIVAVVTGARATPWWRPLRAGAVWVPVLAADLLGLVYLVVFGPPNLLGRRPVQPVGFWAAAHVSLHGLSLHGHEVIGVFGWLDTPVPAPVSTLWLVAVGCLAVNAARRRAVRALVVSGLLPIICVLGATLVEARSYNVVGLYVQTRYMLPLLAGIPLLLLVRGGPDPSLRIVILSCLAAGDLLAFQQELRRYTVGLSGPLFPRHAAWEPALPWPVLATAYLTLVVTAVSLGLRGSRAARKSTDLFGDQPQTSGQAVMDTALTHDLT